MHAGKWCWLCCCRSVVECIKDKRLLQCPIDIYLLYFVYMVFVFFTYKEIGICFHPSSFVLWHYKQQIIAPCSLYFLVAVIPETSRLLWMGGLVGLHWSQALSSRSAWMVVGHLKLAGHSKKMYFWAALQIPPHRSIQSRLRGGTCICNFILYIILKSTFVLHVAKSVVNEVPDFFLYPNMIL
jgi:hypothetical protein